MKSSKMFDAMTQIDERLIERSLSRKNDIVNDADIRMPNDRNDREKMISICISFLVIAIIALIPAMIVPFSNTQVEINSAEKELQGANKHELKKHEGRPKIEYQANKDETTEINEDNNGAGSVLELETDDYHEALVTDDPTVNTEVIEETSGSVQQDDEKLVSENPDKTDPPIFQLTETQVPEDTYPVDQVTEAIPDKKANESGSDNANDIPCLEIYTFSCIDDFKLFCSTGSRDISLYNNGPGYGVFPPFNMKSGSYLGLDSLFPSIDLSKVVVDHIGIQSNYHYWYSGETYPNGVPYLIEISYNDGQSVISTDTIIDEDVNSIKSRIKGYEDFIHYEYIYGDYCDEVTLQPTIRIPVHTDYIWDIDDCILTCGKYKGKPVGVTIRYGNYQISISATTTDNSGFFTDEALFPLSAMFKGGKERKEALRRIVEAVDSVQGQTPQAVIEPAKNRETRVIFSNIPDASETSVDSGAYETDLPLT